MTSRDRACPRRRRRPRGDGDGPRAVPGRGRPPGAHDGRGALGATARRPADAGFEDAGSMDPVVAAASVLISVVPPARPARRPTSSPRRPSHRRPAPVVEADAVAPATVVAVAERLPGLTSSTARSRARRPARTPPTPTRVFLSGPRAGEVAALECPACAGSCSRAGRGRERRQDVHRIGAQGLPGPARAGAAHRRAPRGARRGARRPPARLPRRGRRPRGGGGHQGVALRRRDGRDRRDPGRRRA